jgi:hypothetical protein
MSAVSVSAVRVRPANGWMRLAPWSGIAFVVLFLGSVVASSPPNDSASDARWVADYSTSGKQAGHLATGVLLVVAGLSLLTFLTHLWTTIAAARQPRSVSPLPIVAAGVAAACICVGGVFMGVIAGDMLLGSSPMPDADLLRFCNDIGFVMVGVPGMLAAALGIACLSAQARAAGIFGRRLHIFSLAVAIILLASLEFVPIVALLVWLIVVAVVLLRANPADVHPG